MTFQVLYLLCMQVKGHLNFPRIVELVSNRMVFVRKENGDLVNPKFQQYYVNWMGKEYPCWKWENSNKTKRLGIKCSDKSSKS